MTGAYKTSGAGTFIADKTTMADNKLSSCGSKEGFVNIMAKTYNFQERDEAAERREQIKTAYTRTRPVGKQKLGKLPKMPPKSGNITIKKQVT